MQAQIRVGVADDDEIIRFALSRMLSAPHIRIVAAVPDGEAAVALALSGLIDVLVLDMEMPKLTGEEALRQIRKAAPRVRVLMHSSRPARLDEARLLAAGATAYLEKPCTAARMLQAIHQAAQGDRGSKR